MADQILTQVEVDALLRGLSNGEIKTETDTQDDVANGSIKPYDFSSQERTIRSRMPTLDMINEKFCRQVRTALFNLLRKTIDVSPEGVKTMKYEEFLLNLQVPSSLHVFQFSTLRGQGLLVIDPNLVFLIVDSYFGGDGRFHTRVEGRDFTNVEQAVIRKVVDIMLHEMNEIWKPVHPLDVRIHRSEMNPQFVNITSNIEPVVVSTFKMEFESATNKFFLCIPFTTFEPIKDKLYGGAQRVDATVGDKAWFASINEQLGYVPLSVAGEIGTARISVSELLNLKAGDIIQLERKARDPLDVHIEGLPKLLARPGVMDNNYALKIVSAINGRG